MLEMSKKTFCHRMYSYLWDPVSLTVNINVVPHEQPLTMALPVLDH